MTIFKIFRNELFYLCLILIAAFVVRLYEINTPLADWHSWRQADTSAVSRNFIKEGFNPFYPKFDDLSGISENPLHNPNGYRFVEFPIYNIAVYPVYLLMGVNIIFDRLVSIIFSLGSLIFIFLITKKYTSKVSALLAAATFGLLPFSVFFSRTTLPEPTFVFFSLGMIYFVDRWIWEKKYLVIALLFTMIAFLVKPWAIFFFLPLLYSVIKKEGRIIPVRSRYILFFIAGILPFVIWRIWILQFPEGIPASSWLMNSDHIRFRPAFFSWIISERLGGEILGVTGLFLLLVGLLKRQNNYFLHFWFLSGILYLTIFATGNVRHNYYQYQLLPILSIFVSIGLSSLIKGFNEFIPRVWTIFIGVLFFVLMFYFTWLPVKEFYKINNMPIVKAGEFVDKTLPQNAIIIAPYNGDTAFLYQTNRKGFAFSPIPVKGMITNFGTTHWVSTAKDAKTNWVSRHFEVIEDNPEFIVIDLTKMTKGFSNDDPEP